MTLLYVVYPYYYFTDAIYICYSSNIPHLNVIYVQDKHVKVCKAASRNDANCQESSSEETSR